MMQLMENSEEAGHKALHFLEKGPLEIAITAAELHGALPQSMDYPCLMDFYITYYKKMRENIIYPSLAYHYCSKRTAKCLVYSKTNKITGVYGRWILIGKDTTLEDVQRVRQRFDGQRAIIETYGFGDTLRTCLKNKKPFLLHTEVVRDSLGETQNHQTIVSMENAKSVVYYKKNIKLMGKIDIDELMNIVESSSPQGFRAKVSSVWSERVIESIKKKIKDEI
jgi:hypothetical protein